jgi:hypothetical protein
MRAFALPLAVGLAGLLAWCAAVLIRALRTTHRNRRRGRARWVAAVTIVDECTVVAVRLTTTGHEVLAEHVVARIYADEADWQRRLLAARQEAEERAFHLNT